MANNRSEDGVHNMKLRTRNKVPDIPNVQPGKSKSYFRVKKHRENLKNDPLRYQAHKEKERRRKQEFRIKERERLLKDKRLAQDKRNKKTEYMRKFRAEKKAKAEKEIPSTAKSLAGKSTAVKIKERERKQNDRIRQKQQKAMDKLKKANNTERVRNWRLRVQLRPSTSNTNEDQSPDATLMQTPTSDNAASRLYWSTRRSVKKAKSILPNTPAKRGHVVEKLLDSPRVSNYLSRKNIIISNEQKKKNEIGEALIGVLDESLAETKPSGTSSKSKARAYSALKHIAGTRLVLQRYFKLRKRLPNVPSWWKACDTARKKRKDRVSDEIRQDISDFYLRPEISREVPSKREVIHVTDKQGEKVAVQKHVMVMTLGDAYREYKQHYPDAQVGFSTFKSLKPQQVRKVSETNRRTCLCKICCNVALKVDALKTFLQKVAKDDPEVSTFTNITKQGISSLTTCHNRTANCLQRECPHCGTSNLKTTFESLLSKYRDEPLRWFKWEYIKIQKKDNVKTCMSCKTHETSLLALFDDLEDDLLQYPAHEFRAGWQHEQMCQCISKLEEGEVAAVMDFSENYSCRFQNEVQTAFFDQNQVTLHPMMFYYDKEIDGEIRRVKHAMIGVSDDLKHDACLVREFQDKALAILRQSVEVRKLYEWTDGCAAQYKARSAFADISIQNTKLERNFFETSHGKSVCDGLGAVIKNVCYQAVLTGKAVLSTADDVYSYCSSRLSHGYRPINKDGKNEMSARDFIFISDAETNHNKAELDVQTVEGTRKLHAVVNSPGKPYTLHKRNLSCFCRGCKSQEECINADFVSPWVHHELILKKKRVSTRQNQSPSSSASVERDTTDNRQETDTAGSTSVDANTHQEAVADVTPDLPDGQLNHATSVDKIKINTYIAVQFQGVGSETSREISYMALVTDVRGEHFQLKFLKRSNKGLYEFTTEREATHPKTDIIRPMEEPAIVQVGRAFQYRFNQDEVEQLDSKFVLK